MRSRERKDKERKMGPVDVTAHALGIAMWDEAKSREVNYIVIPKDTPVPAERVILLTTTRDNQTAATVTLLEGEDEDPQYCTVVGGGFTLDGIPPQPKGVPQIEVTMQYDKEGIIHLAVKEVNSGKELRVEAKREDLLSEEGKKEIAERVGKSKAT